MDNYKNWTLQIDENQILWLKIDRKDSTVNSIDSDTLDELNHILKEISQQESTLKGLAIYSDKKSGFIAGADISRFAQLSDKESILDFLRHGHRVFARLEALTIPTVAMIDGFCLGGGLELALACNYRIATSSPKTRIGLPEILLGIHPGWGGTVRLPQLIGGLNALSEIILKGAALTAYKAKKMGVVDDVVPYRQLKRAAIYYLINKPAKHRPGFMESLSNVAWIRPLIAKILRYNVSKKVRKEHYPAPFAVIDLWEKEGGVGERAYLKEIESVEQLVTEGETAKNLIRAFYLKEQLKAFSKDSPFKAHHVHVVGAGTMGGDIAAWCALNGLYVSLQDKSYEQIAPAIGRAQKLFEKKLKEPHLIQAAMDKLVPDPEGNGIKNADVIIEAVFENLEVKQSIIKMVESKAKITALIATNTSSIPLDEINSVMVNPERLVGIHYFNPVAKMELVEVVSGKQTSQSVAEEACAFVGQIGRLPLPVKSSPGFLVNRILISGFMECLQLIDEGIEPERIDEAAKSFGMLMGPLEMSDTVGLDICLSVVDNLTQHYGGRISEILIQMVNDGKLGRKSGQGFYRYKQGNIIKKNVSASSIDHEISQRLVLRMISESIACLKEKVVENADLLDAAMIFGTGFAPFRGGPMTYAKSCGKEKLAAQFEKMQVQHGERFNTKILTDIH